MKYLLLLVLCSTVNFNCALSLIPSVEAFGTVTEYYWKDYNGLIPSDAVPGGKDADGKITYIGQMSISAEYNTEISKIHTIPVTITNGNITAVGAYHEKTVTSNDDSNVKVLCGGSTYSFKWHSQQELVSSGCRYIIAGFEDSVPMFVGRTEHNKQTILGKVFSDGSRHYTGLIIPYQNGEYLPQTYEILMYCR